VVVVGIEDHLEVVGVRLRVAPDQTGADARATGRIVHPGAHIQRLVVVGKADLGAVDGGLALMRLALGEVAGRGRRLPHRLIEAAIEGDGGGEPDRRHGRRRGGVNGRLLGGDSGGDHRQGGGERQLKTHETSRVGDVS
jgi:hypothetical protein